MSTYKGTWQLNTLKLKGSSIACNVSGLGDGLEIANVKPEQSIINNQKYNKMKKVEKSLSAGITDESSTNVDGSQVSQPIAKHNVVCQGGKFECLLCGRNKFTRKSPHYCVGGFRKHHIKWKELK